MKTIKLNLGVDFIILVVINEQKEEALISQWPISSKDEADKEKAIALAKVAAFDEMWRYSEMGAKVQLNPYLN